jgi:2-phospho-L-lactate guanylyltransferase
VRAAVVPIRSLAGGKQRLAGRLDPDERHQLARALATGVLDALVRAGEATALVVVTSDPEVTDLATGRGATVLPDPGGGLDAAVVTGVAHARDRAALRVVVAHADLPFPAELTEVADAGPPDGVVLVPDRRGDGTNVVVVPADAGFRFAYGPGSFERHRAEAGRTGRPVIVLDDTRLGWDVDLPEDLDPPAAWGAPSWGSPAWSTTRG